MSVRDLLFNALNDLSIRLEPDLRRLVEEAQAETKACKTTIETLGADLAASNAQLEACRDAARDSLDRLNGELKTMTCMWQGLVDNAPKLHGEIRRLKGELAEARRLLMTAPLNVHADSLLAWMKARTKHLATPPAEQAQGEGALTLEMLDEVLRDHINDEYNRSTELAKRVEALDKRANANDLDFVTLERRARYMEEALGRHRYGERIDALAKLAEQLKPRCRQCGKAVEPERFCYAVPTCYACLPPPEPLEVAKWTHAFEPMGDGQITRVACKHCGCIESLHEAPPPPEAAGPAEPVDLMGAVKKAFAAKFEAAGPGHRFICSSGFDDNCGPSCVCKECDHRLGDHAVPPIPEGTR
jgi:hypothetical protein